jgi:hypothetical protein
MLIPFPFRLRLLANTAHRQLTVARKLWVFLVGGNRALPRDASATTFPSGKVKAQITRSRARSTLLSSFIVTACYYLARRER